ncbi:MAG: hypothetical protein UX94_C0006G0013 [Parcubacteria group bacterium GW2011_GWA2_47_21]|nr:MAG: hypothetical protein UX94_C0006G0013 [Parcubacteria group bacterium GW2011_GWA2_47_21]
MNQNHHPYWQPEEIRAINESERLEEAVQISLKIIRRIPDPVAMVSGPLTTGGLGSFEANLRLFGFVILKLSAEGHYIFSQLPAEDLMVKVWRKWLEPCYCMPILEDFYRSIFESGLVKRVHFIPGWQRSFGARWEKEECHRLGIETNFLSDESVKDLAQKALLAS